MYTKFEMWENNMNDFLLNSVTVPYGYILELYPNDGFTGTPTVIVGAESGEHDEPKC